MPIDCIQCVLVLYKVALQDSETFQTLIAAVSVHPALASRMSLLIYDNSPIPQSVNLPNDIFTTARYEHDSSNGGLSMAYKQALFSAEASSCSWLLLLDQDTTIVPSLIPALFAAIDSEPLAEVCGIVPRLVQNDVLLSPVSVQSFRYQAMDVHVSGYQSQQLTALNSGACLRVNALKAIGGFPSEYWLDFLDHAIFHRLHTRGGRLFVLDVTIPHRLSTNNLGKESSLPRYDNMLTAEWRFVRETGWGGGHLPHRLRLLKRALRTLVILREPAFALQVLKRSLH